jgi:hypothetical protein
VGWGEEATVRYLEAERIKFIWGIREEEGFKINFTEWN